MAWQVIGSWTFTSVDEFVDTLNSGDYRPRKALGLMYPSLPCVGGGAVCRGSEVEAKCTFVGKCGQGGSGRIWGAWFPLTVDVVTYVEMAESETGEILGKWAVYGDAEIFPNVIRYTGADVARTDGGEPEVRGPERG